MNNKIKWALVLPAGYLAAFAICRILNLVLASLLDPISTPFVIVQQLLNILWGFLFVFCGAWVAPKSKKKTAYALTAFAVILFIVSSFIWWSTVEGPIYAFLANVIIRSVLYLVGGLLASFFVHDKQPDKTTEANPDADTIF